MGCATGDIDNDGDTDLLVTYWGPNLLYRNNGDSTLTKSPPKPEWIIPVGAPVRLLPIWIAMAGWTSTRPTTST